MTLHALSLLVPFLIVIAMVPLAAACARRVGLVDKPDARRKLHGKVVPLVGGLSVAAAVAGSILLLTYHNVATIWLSSALVLGGVAIVFLVGLADDWLRIPGKYKLLGQLAASGALVWGGVEIDTIDLFGYHLHAGWVSVPLTLFWLVGASNSVNLLDGMDGMVGTVGLSIVLGLAGVFVVRGHEVGILVSLAGVGALAGFLIFNLPPARIFMGDSGSLTLGLVLGVLALKLEGGDGRFTIGPGCVALFFLPIADSCAAFARRLLTGRSIFATDRGHLHHRLIQAGYSTRQVLGFVFAMNMFIAAGLVGRELLGSVWPLAAAVALVGAILVIGRLFGHTELMLIARRGADRFPIPATSRRRLGRVLRVHIQGSCRAWDETWAIIRGKAAVLKAQTLCLNISAPALHETYLARWESSASQDGDTGRWRADWPVRHNGQVIGWLTVVAEPCHNSSAQAMSAVTDLVIEIEEHITKTVAEAGAAKAQEEASMVPSEAHSRFGFRFGGRPRRRDLAVVGND